LKLYLESTERFGMSMVNPAVHFIWENIFYIFP